MIILPAVVRVLGAARKRFAASPLFLFAAAAIALGVTLSMTVPYGSVLIVAVLLAPDRWRGIALSSSVGSSIGALVLYVVFHHLGWSQIVEAYPDVAQSKAWRDATHWLSDYGSVALFAIAALPVPQTPALIFAAIYEMPLPEVWLAILLGKAIKYGIYAAIVAAFPHYFLKRYEPLLALTKLNRHLQD